MDVHGGELTQMNVSVSDYGPKAPDVVALTIVSDRRL